MLPVDGWPARLRLLSPEVPEALLLPANDGLRFDDDERIGPGGKLVLQDRPEQPFEGLDGGPGPLAFVDRELLAQRQVLHGQICLAPAEGADQRKQHLHDVHEHSSGHRVLLQAPEQVTRTHAHVQQNSWLNRLPRRCMLAGTGGEAVTDDSTREPATRPQGGDVHGYDAVLASVVTLLESARRASARAVNAVMTATYWEVGRRIVEYEQGGEDRAEYGKRLIERLSQDLASQFGRGFSSGNLWQMRKFYLQWPQEQIPQTASGQSRELPTGAQTGHPDETNGEGGAGGRNFLPQGLEQLAAAFPLSWSHYVRLLSVKDEHGRRFYETEALRNGWTIRQLSRQISTQFYERTALSRNKASLLKKGAVRKPEDAVTAEEELKDPFVLEFLGLKDEYSEADLEEALIHRLEDFLLELGGDFAFIGRQRRLRIGNQWYRVDLLFFHRRLRCLIVIDLKTGRFGHADVGQMHLYLNYAREHWALPDENPPVGLILCAEKDEAVAHYALGNLPNKLLAAEYKTVLPDADLIAAEIERTRRQIESRKSDMAAIQSSQEYRATDREDEREE